MDIRSLSLAIILPLTLLTATPAAAAPADQQLRLWYDAPAPDSTDGWLDRSIPMGNGYLGANLFGGVAKDRIQLTENSLQDVNADSIGGLNSFAEVFVDYPHEDPAGYSRDLVLDDGVSHVSYQNDGVTFTREYFTSYPDKVLAMRISASRPGALDFTLRPTIPYQVPYRTAPGDHRGKSGTVTAAGDTINLAGTMEYYNLQFEGQFKVLPEGGTLTAASGTISVTGADSAVILLAAGTSYRAEPQVFSASDRLDKLKGFPHPHEKVTRDLADASARSYDELLSRHQADYRGLYDRVELDLNATAPAITTDRLVDAARGGTIDPYLTELAFQFGRYLLICSSRPGTLPPNLQGIWNVYQDPPWQSGYWHNVNLQMNYSPAFVGNLAETFDSYLGFYNAYRPRQQQRATDYVKQYNPSQAAPDGDNGWSMGNSMWPYTGGGKVSHSGFGTGGWTAMMFWEYYEYTQDKELLDQVVYPALRGQSNFLSRFVTEHDGLLLADPSASPENGVQSVGTTFDQQMIYENHRNTIAAAKVLGRDDPLLPTLAAQLPKLDPIVVGRSGQIKEYREEQFYGEVGDPLHRHISQLLGISPGQLITSETPAWQDAAKVSLRGRGNKAGTGWGQAERIGTWARLGDGEQARHFVDYWLSHHAMHNLFNNHRDSFTTKLFQVDGNFGFTAGVADMLLQSQEGVVAPLPALPASWSKGSYTGLKARGNFNVSAEWSGGHADRFAVVAKVGGPLTLRYPGIAGAAVTVDGAPADVTPQGTDQIKLDTAVGQRVEVTAIPAVAEVAPAADLRVGVDARDAVRLDWRPSAAAASYNVYRASGSAPAYQRIAQGVTGGSFVDSAAVSGIEQATYRVTAVSANGRESVGVSTVRLRPESTPARVLRVDHDLLGYDAGDGRSEGLSVAGNRYTAGLSWAGGNLTEVRLDAHATTKVALRNEMFGRPVRVYGDRGAPVPFTVDGDRLQVQVRAGQSYRITALASTTVTATTEQLRPGGTFGVSVTVRALDRQPVPASTVAVRFPAGWTAEPAQVRLPAVKPGLSKTSTFTVSVPSATADGEYGGSATMTTDGWSMSAPATVTVRLPNLARGKPAVQSSLASGGVPERGVDGNTNGAWSSGTITHTDFQQEAWWQVDLGAAATVGEVVVWGRQDGCCKERLNDYYVLVSDTPFTSESLAETLTQPGVWSQHLTSAPSPSTTVPVGRTGRYVRVQLTAASQALSLAEVQVFPVRG